MKSKVNIFYSWQSDLKSNKNFIQTCIEKAIKEVKKKYQNEIFLEINIDRDTKNKPGSPQITNTIFSKIKICDIFISDVTIINRSKFIKYFNKRITPNPNVLIELGYASAILGWQRIICINDLKFSLIEELPFDLRGHRISTFNSKNIKEKEKESLISTLKVAIISIIENYDNIIAEHKKSNIYEHDYNIYQNINKICNEQSLLDSISVITTNLFTNQYYLELWDAIESYYSLSENKFLDKEVDNLMELFLKELRKFHSLIMPHFHSDNGPEYMEYLRKKNSGIEMTDDEIFHYKQSRHFNARKEPYRNESWLEADKRIWKLQDELEESSVKLKLAYRNLVVKIKENRL